MIKASWAATAASVPVAPSVAEAAVFCDGRFASPARAGSA